MSADAGADHRAMLALQATVKDLSARLVMLESRVHTCEDALETARAVLESAGPSPKSSLDDPNMPSEADKIAMRERLRARTLEGIKANKTDPTRAGRTFRRDIS